jgi:hypothetical protein
METQQVIKTTWAAWKTRGWKEDRGHHSSETPWDKIATRLEQEEVSQYKKTSQEEVTITINNLLVVLVSLVTRVSLGLELIKASTNNNAHPLIKET